MLLLKSYWLVNELLIRVKWCIKELILNLTMKWNRTYLFIIISSLALLIVLIIQVRWIFETAKIKEEIFNEKANLVLSQTLQTLSSDTVTINNIRVEVNKNEIRKIDSLLKYYMTFYHINLSYYFEVKANLSEMTAPNAFMYNKGSEPGCYQQCLPEGVGNKATGFGLKLVFPDEEKYIFEEMGIPFITSIFLILIVLVMFWRTTVSLIKEKEIAEHTADFLNNMTHEFKTPLTNIALAGKMIVNASQLKTDDKIRNYSGIILQENEKLRLQVEQVLSMSALESGEIPLLKTELDFHELIKDAVKCMNIQIEGRNGYLKLHLNAHSFIIMGDKIKLTNVLYNLIDNALKYSGEKPLISLQTADSSHGIVLTVSDNGIGIEKEYHSKVFDKYFRMPTGDVHDVKGFGLGLTYVKKIIELHKRIIKIESEKRKGTSFTIFLPHD
ncbi:MAG: hypothetical protein JWO32_893 [Bacteroidetes bacterium]|nr:hypothetical protein [Bacteroidota bacterium]